MEGAQVWCGYGIFANNSQKISLLIERVAANLVDLGGDGVLAAPDLPDRQSHDAQPSQPEPPSASSRATRQPSRGRKGG